MSRILEVLGVKYKLLQCRASREFFNAVYCRLLQVSRVSQISLVSNIINFASNITDLFGIEYLKTSLVSNIQTSYLPHILYFFSFKHHRILSIDFLQTSLESNIFSVEYHRFPLDSNIVDSYCVEYHRLIQCRFSGTALGSNFTAVSSVKCYKQRWLCLFVSIRLTQSPQLFRFMCQNTASLNSLLTILFWIISVSVMLYFN